MISNDVSPLLAFIVGVTAAVPAFALTHRSRRGRVRSAVAYLSGFALGMCSAAVLFQMLQVLAVTMPFGSAALAGAFFGPFAGLMWGAWIRSGRKKNRRSI
jgi:hypothetical protein